MQFILTAVGLQTVMMMIAKANINNTIHIS